MLRPSPSSTSGTITSVVSSLSLSMMSPQDPVLLGERELTVDQKCFAFARAEDGPDT